MLKIIIILISSIACIVTINTETLEIVEKHAIVEDYFERKDTDEQIINQYLKNVKNLPVKVDPSLNQEPI